MSTWRVAGDGREWDVEPTRQTLRMPSIWAAFKIRPCRSIRLAACSLNETPFPVIVPFQSTRKWQQDAGRGQFGLFGGQSGTDSHVSESVGDRPADFFRRAKDSTAPDSAPSRRDRLERLTFGGVIRFRDVRGHFAFRDRLNGHDRSELAGVLEAAVESVFGCEQRESCGSAGSGSFDKASRQIRDSLPSGKT